MLVSFLWPHCFGFILFSVAFLPLFSILIKYRWDTKKAATRWPPHLNSHASLHSPGNGKANSQPFAGGGHDLDGRATAPLNGQVETAACTTEHVGTTSLCTCTLSKLLQMVRVAAAESLPPFASGGEADGLRSWHC